MAYPWKPSPFERAVDSAIARENQRYLESKRCECCGTPITFEIRYCDDCQIDHGGEA